MRAAASGERAESQTRRKKSVVKHPSSNAAREHHKCQTHKLAFKRGKMLIRGRGVIKPPGRGETAWRRSERPIMREEAGSHSLALSTGPESKPQTQAGLQLWYQGHCENQGLSPHQSLPLGYLREPTTGSGAVWRQEARKGFQSPQEQILSCVARVRHWWRVRKAESE